MSSEPYVPNLNEVRADFVALHTRNFDPYQAGRSLTSEQEYYGDQFDRFIAKVRADALREAAGAWQVETGGTRPGPRNFMVRRADRIEREARDGS